jgi:hypothetical protein
VTRWADDRITSWMTCKSVQKIFCIFILLEVLVSAKHLRKNSLRFMGDKEAYLHHVMGVNIKVDFVALIRCKTTNLRNAWGQGHAGYKKVSVVKSESYTGRER